MLPKSDYDLVKTALRELQAQLAQKYGKQAPQILVYGSYARQQAHVDSDIDVLLVYPGDVHPGKEIQQIGDILADLNLRYQILISVFPASQKTYQRSEGKFWDNIRREAKPIHEI